VDGIAYPYAQPIPYSYGKPVGWGWTVPLRGFSVIRGVVTSLLALRSDPYHLHFGVDARTMNVDKNSRLAPEAAQATGGELVVQPRQLTDAGWELLQAGRFADVIKLISEALQAHADWIAEAKTVDQALARQPHPYPRAGPDGSMEQIFQRYGSLYYIGTAEWIRLDAALRINRHADAVDAAAHLLRDFPHTQIWDNKGFFWKPVQALTTEGRFQEIYREAQRQLGRAQAEPKTRRELWTRLLMWVPFSAAVGFALLAGAKDVSAQVIQQPKAWQEAVLYTVEALPPQTLTLLAIVVVIVLMAAAFGLRHWLGKHALPQGEGTALSRWWTHFVAEKGHFYLAVLIATAIVEGLNVFAYLTQTPDYVTHVFRIKQIGLLVVGIVYVAKVVQLVLSAVWMVSIRPASGPTPYQMSDTDIPRVTVQIAIRSEPFDVVKMTIDSALALRYPVDHLEIQVIDNSDREDQYAQVRAYAESHDVVFIHRDGTEGFKAGNLNIGIEKANGDYFLILDADSVVEPETLLKVMPEFKLNPRLGYAQMRIFITNANENALTKVFSLGSRTNYRLYDLVNEQGFVKFDGHNGILSRKALAAIGNWPYEVSEDLAASIRLRIAGYEGKYISYVTTGEEAPRTFPELMKQQRKWAFGTTKLLLQEFKTIVTSPAFRWYEKVDLLFKMGDFSLTAFGVVLIFAYIQFPFTGALIILSGPYIPILIANRHLPALSLARDFFRATLIYSALLPTIFIGVAKSVLRHKEGFRITFKGAARQRPLADVLRANTLGLFVAGLFYTFLPRVYPDLPAYFEQIPPSVIATLSIAFGPLLFNYGKPYLGQERSSESTSRRKIGLWLASLALLMPSALDFPTYAQGGNSIYMTALLALVGVGTYLLSRRLVLQLGAIHFRSAPARFMGRIFHRGMLAIGALAVLLILNFHNFVLGVAERPMAPNMSATSRSGSQVFVVENSDGKWLSVNGRLWSGVPGFVYQPVPPGMSIENFMNGRVAYLYKALLPPNGDGIDPAVYPDLIALAKDPSGAPAQGHAQAIVNEGGHFFHTFSLASTTENDLRKVSRIFKWAYEAHGLMFKAGLYNPSPEQATMVARVLKDNPGLLMYTGWNEYNMWTDRRLSYQDIVHDHASDFCLWRHRRSCQYRSRHSELGCFCIQLACDSSNRSSWDSRLSSIGIVHFAPSRMVLIR
jgi:cellulose synthase/poly-beta-1,6-N-acetylglucosamine synthase-like glycosyltransferase